MSRAGGGDYDEDKYAYEMAELRRQHENAINRGQLRPDSDVQRLGCLGPQAEHRGVREAVQVLGHPGNFYVQPDGSLEKHPRTGCNPDVRTEANVSPVVSEWRTKLWEACDSLCGLFRTLGCSDWTTRYGHNEHSVSGSGLWGLRIDIVVRFQGAPDPVEKPELPGRYSLEKLGLRTYPDA